MRKIDVKGGLTTSLLILAPVFAILSIGHGLSVIGRYNPLYILIATVYCILFSVLQIAIFWAQKKGRIPKKLPWVSLFYGILIVLIYPGLMSMYFSPTINPFAQLEAAVGIIFGICGFANSVRGLK